MLDRLSLVILGVFFTLMLVGLSFIAHQTVQVVHIQREITAANERMMQQHQTFLANQATILRDNDRMLHEHDTTTQDHRAILQRLAR